MASKKIIERKVFAEKNHLVDFVTFTSEDCENFTTKPCFFPNLEEHYKNGIKLRFCHKIGPKDKFHFITVVFMDSVINHPDQTIKDALKEIVGKKLRLYRNIFEEYYFDFEDQCFPTRAFKIKNN